MRLACVQTMVRFGDPGANASSAVEHLRRLAADGVDLVVFPEAYLTGYCVDSREEAASIAIRSDHESLESLRQTCEELNVLSVVGFAERFPDGSLWNSAALFEPGTPTRIYRKTHLPFLGLDRFVSPGDSLPVFETRLGKIGILICFDMRPPEATRSMVLDGADLVILPTNWPVGAETSADHICIARASENRVYFASCNRVGEENGFRFIGRSKIIAPNGTVLASAGADEDVLVADIDLDEARRKRTVNVLGKYEIDVIESRNPSLYSRLTKDSG